jgi:hypothetical protein
MSHRLTSTRALPTSLAGEDVAAVHHVEPEAERYGAAMIVVGTSGQPAIGSVTARLLHGSPVPVALALHGFRSRPGAHVERVTARSAALRGS